MSLWLAFFPVSLIFGLLIEAIFPDWSEFGTITKVFLTTTILTPVMTVCPAFDNSNSPVLANGRRR